jgi:uncharacterized protein YkwD
VTHRRRRLAGLLTIVAVSLGAGAVAAPAALAAPAPAAVHVGAQKPAVAKGLKLTPFEARLLALTNKARKASGLRALTAVPGATDVARRWALHLASDQSLGHNPKMVAQMEKAGSPSWMSLAENVGKGPADDADALFKAYMDSARHRTNLLSPRAKFIGIGTVQIVDSNGVESAWNTMTFTDQYSSSYGKARTTLTGVVPSDALGTLAGRWKTSL